MPPKSPKKNNQPAAARGKGASIDWSETRGRLEQTDRILGAAGDLTEAEAEAILQSRADALAHRGRTRAGDESAERLLVFEAGGARFALAVEALSEVIRLTQCTPVPGAPAELIGIASHHGSLVAVIDLAVLMGLRTGPDSESTGKGMLLLPRQTRLQTGFRVDSVAEIRDVPAEEISGMESSDEGGAARFTRGLTAGGIGVLDPSRLSRLDRQALVA